MPGHENEFIVINSPDTPRDSEVLLTPEHITEVIEPNNYLENIAQSLPWA